MRGATRSTTQTSSYLSYFNPRSSCEERLDCAAMMMEQSLFQSTLLMRGATSIRATSSTSSREFQSPLLMRGATFQQFAWRDWNTFQSTLLMRGATAIARWKSSARLNFNPRSSCEERPGRLSLNGNRGYFNPRSSCEERLTTARCSAGSQRFQSTLLMRGATI